MVSMTCLRLLNIASGTCRQQNHDLRDWCPLLKGNRRWGRGFGHTTFAFQAPALLAFPTTQCHIMLSRRKCEKKLLGRCIYEIFMLKELFTIVSYMHCDFYRVNVKKGCQNAIHSVAIWKFTAPGDVCKRKSITSRTV